MLPHELAAVSVGLIDGEMYLDLDYDLDSNADVDMNVSKPVMVGMLRFKELGKRALSLGRVDQTSIRSRRWYRYYLRGSKDCFRGNSLSELL